jgi:hypothetical protein
MPNPPSFFGLVANVHAANWAFLAFKSESLHMQYFLYLSIYFIIDGGNLIVLMKVGSDERTEFTISSMPN